MCDFLYDPDHIPIQGQEGFHDSFQFASFQFVLSLSQHICPVQQQRLPCIKRHSFITLQILIPPRILPGQPPALKTAPDKTRISKPRGSSTKSAIFCMRATTCAHRPPHSGFLGRQRASMVSEVGWQSCAAPLIRGRKKIILHNTIYIRTLHKLFHPSSFQTHVHNHARSTLRSRSYPQ